MIVQCGFLIQLRSTAAGEVLLHDLQIIEAPDIQTTRGVIRDNIIGVNIQDTELDLATAFVDVQSFDNENDFDTQDLPVPSAVEALDAVGGD